MLAGNRGYQSSLGGLDLDVVFPFEYLKAESLCFSGQVFCRAIGKSGAHVGIENLNGEPFSSGIGNKLKRW